MGGGLFSNRCSRFSDAHIRLQGFQQFQAIGGRLIFKMWLSPSRHAHSSLNFAAISRVRTVDVPET
eukprot:6169684-Pyramimonas_sp.AAC.1